VPRHLRFLFRICPEVSVRSRVRPDVWARSLSDELLRTHTVTRESMGYTWGVAGQELYPGASIVEPSSRAQLWARETGIQFHEVHIEANAHEISIVFSELTMEEVAPGYVPFRVEADGVAERYASGSKIPFPPDLPPTEASGPIP
jgi:hypothetical protein